MKKIIVTEEQSKKLVDKIISEQYAGSDRFSQNVKIEFDYHNLTYKGQEVDWIPSNYQIRVSFRIDLEYREYGIKTISVYDFQGPEEIEVPVTYYPEGSEDSIDEDVLIKLDWSNVQTEETDIGWIGIGDTIQVELSNDEDGNLVNRGNYGYGILIFTKTI